jgi:hypothetical protein
MAGGARCQRAGTGRSAAWRRRGRPLVVSDIKGVGGGRVAAGHWRGPGWAPVHAPGPRVRA